MTKDLKELSDRDLHAHIKQLVAQKRTADLKLMEALVVMRKVQAYQRTGFYSLAEYMRDALGFSRDESWKTSQAVEVICQSQRAWELLEAGQTYVSHLAMLRAKLTSQNADQIFEFLPGKSRRELESFLSTIDRQGNKTGKKARVKLMIDCPPELIEKIEHLSQLRSQASHKGDWAAVLEEAVDGMIEKIDPVKKAERALARQSKSRSAHSQTADAADADAADADAAAAMQPAMTRSSSRGACPGAVTARRVRIPAAVRHGVYLRHGSQCCYVGHDGRRCQRRRGLQIDHMTPVSRGGDNHPENLRLLCPIHNRVEAARLLGRSFMRGKMPH